MSKDNNISHTINLEGVEIEIVHNEDGWGIFLIEEKEMPDSTEGPVGAKRPKKAKP